MSLRSAGPGPGTGHDSGHDSGLGPASAPGSAPGSADGRPGPSAGARPPEAGVVDVRLVERVEDGRRWPTLVWAPGPGWRMVSTAVVGGGIGPRAWWVNAKVPMEYHRPDPTEHVREIAAALGVSSVQPPGALMRATAELHSAHPGRSHTGAEPGSDGVGMLTAADVTRWTTAESEGVVAVATVGLGLPVWPAADDATVARETGTINILVRVPVPLVDAALVNAVVTATEAKTQALVEAGIPGSGTSSDAVCIACPDPDLSLAGAAGPAEEYGGPRSPWGLRIARAVHRAVADGTADWVARHPPGDPHRRWPAS